MDSSTGEESHMDFQLLSPGYLQPLLAPLGGTASLGKHIHLQWEESIVI